MLIAAFALAACETPEERFARLLPAAETRCDSFGHQKGSKEYAACLQGEVARLEDKEDAEAAAIAAAGPMPYRLGGERQSVRLRGVSPSAVALPGADDRCRRQ